MSEPNKHIDWCLATWNPTGTEVEPPPFPGQSFEEYLNMLYAKLDITEWSAT